jgi:hypothetical protein
MPLHISAEICIACGEYGASGGDIAIPTDDVWLSDMRNSVLHGGLVVLRFDNKPVDGSTGKVALTIGPATCALGVSSEEDDDYLCFGSGAEEPRLFGFLLDRHKLAELITALQLLQTHFPADEGAPNG